GDETAERGARSDHAGVDVAHGLRYRALSAFRRCLRRFACVVCAPRVVLSVGPTRATQITRDRADNAAGRQRAPAQTTRQRRRQRPVPCSAIGMSNDEKGATEEDMQKIDVIRGAEVLGYEGAGREEHSGENSPTKANEQR